MTRTRHTLQNIFVATFVSAITIMVGFVAQRIFVNTLGLEYLGINGLFTNIIAMLGLVELGLGSAIIYHLYKPLADNDTDRIKVLLDFYKRSYRTIALIVLIIGLALTPFIGRIVGNVNITENIYVIYFFFLADVVFSYLLSYKRSVLFADQKNYIISSVHLGYVLVMNGLQILILLNTKNFYLYLAIKVIMRVIENAIISAIVNNRYQYLSIRTSSQLDKNTKNDIYEKMRALFMHKIGFFVVLGSDNIIISLFIGIKAVGLYSNYLLVITAVTTIIGQMFTSLTASVGSLLYNKQHHLSYGVYCNVLFANFWLGSIGAIGFLVCMDPFVQIWLGKDFILPFGVLLTLAINLYLQLTRSTSESFKDAAGIFHQDRFIPIVESVINIFFAVLFLHYFGLAGVFMGTICSNLFIHLFDYPKYAYTVLFKRSYRNYYTQFLQHLILAFVAGMITLGISRAIVLDRPLFQLIFNTIISFIIPSAIFYVFYRKTQEYKYFRQLVVKLNRYLYHTSLRNR